MKNAGKRFIYAFVWGLIALGAFLAAPVTRTAHADGGPPRLISVTPAVGIASGETLRVNFLNVGTAPFEMDPCLFDASGEHIKTGARITLVPGQTRSLDLSYAEAASRGTGLSVRVRAGVHINESDVKSLAVSGEVIEDATGKTTIFIPGTTSPKNRPNAEDENSTGGEMTRSVAPVGISSGQSIRISYVNVGSNPFEIIPCVFDGDGVHLKTGAPVSLAPGQTFSFSMSSSEAPVPSATRLLVRGAAHVRNSDARNLLMTGEVIEDSSGRSELFVPGVRVGFDPQPDPAAGE